MRVFSFLALALALSFAAGPVRADDAKKSKALELYDTFRELVTQGKYDIAVNFLQQFLEANPTDVELLELEKKYGATVFLSLRNIPRWSDDANLEKKARAAVEDAIKRLRAADDKLLYDPARVAKFIRNLGASYEEKVFAQLELKRTGDYAIPFMVDELRNTRDKEIAAGLIESIGLLEGHTLGGWVAALDGFTPEQQIGVIAAIAGRRDLFKLQTFAQTDLSPYLWRVLARPDSNSASRRFAQEFLARLHPRVKIDNKAPEAELLALAGTFYDHSARFAGGRTNSDGSPNSVPVWAWDAAAGKVTKVEEVPVSKAEEYYGLRYARWVVEANPTYEPAQALLLSLAAERAIERARFGSLAKAEPVVYRLLSDAPSRVLSDLLERGLNQKKAGLALAMIQVLGDRAEGDKTTLYVKALGFPDPQVQFSAADALLRSPSGVPASAKPLIVDILRRAAAADPGSPDGTMGRALLADPDHVRATAVSGVLRGLGFDVEVVNTGRGLLRRIGQSSDFDLIVIDHHTPNPELIDLIGQIKADAKAANRPTLVVASPDRSPRPTYDQLLVRLAALIAATENYKQDVPDPQIKDAASYKPEEFEKLQQEIKKNAEVRDGAFRRAADTRLARMNRLIDSSGVQLNENQKLLLRLRLELLTYTLLKMQYPFADENAPQTVTEMSRLRKQLDLQPASSPYGAGMPTIDLLNLIERFEADLARVPQRKKEFEQLYARIDPTDFGMAVNSFHDPATEARVRRTLRGFPDVRVIAEPYGPASLLGELKVVYQDPSQMPRESADKKSTQKLSVEWLRRMAVGDLPGYEIASTEKELRASLRNDDLADAAIDAVARFRTAGAQEDLMVLVLNPMRPAPLRAKAADAVIRHIQAHGKSIPKAQLQPLAELADKEPDLALRGKLLTLKTMLAFEPGGYVDQLKGYNPPLVPPPAPKAPAKTEKD